MKQVIKLKLQPRGRITIPEAYREAGGYMPGDILVLTIEKAKINKEA